MRTSTASERINDGRMFEVLLTTAHRLAVEMHNQLSVDGLSTMGLVALRILVREPSRRTVTMLSASLGAARQSMTELVDRLVRDGFVERVADTRDLRSKVLQPTARGIEAEVLVRDALERCMASFARDFSTREKAALHALLDRLDRGADGHRTERLWNIHRSSPGSRPPAIHVR